METPVNKGVYGLTIEVPRIYGLAGHPFRGEKNHGKSIFFP